MAHKKTITAASLVHDGQPIATQAVPQDFSWQRDSTGSETQTLYFNLDNGLAGFVQIAWAYLALTTTIETHGMFYVPGQPAVFELHNGHNLKVKDSSYHYECKGLSMAWDPTHTKLKTRYTAGKERDAAKGAMTEIEFERQCEGYKIGDGKNHIGSGTVAHHFYPTGTIKMRGEVGGHKFESSGIGMFIHAHSANIMPYNVGVEWNMVFLTGHREGKDTEENRASFHVLQYMTPASVGSVNCSNSGLTEGNKLRAVFWDTKVEHFEKAKDTEGGSDYEVPARVVFTSTGKTVDGKAAKVVFDARPTKRLQSIDILGEMPYVIRRLVQALITKPYIFERYVENAKATVEIEGEDPYTIVGAAFNELTLMK